MPNETPATLDIPETHDLPPLKRVSITGLHAASMGMYDACLRIIELANLIEAIPEVQTLIGNDLKLKLVTTRMCAQQALDEARVCS